MNWQGQVLGALAVATLLIGGDARAAEVELKVMHFLPASAPAQNHKWVSRQRKKRKTKSPITSTAATWCSSPPAWAAAPAPAQHP